MSDSKEKVEELYNYGLITKEEKEERQKVEDSKEFGAIIEAIYKWTKSRKNEVCFIGAFIAYTEKEEHKDNRIILYGNKEGLEMQIKDIKKALKEEIDFTFINV